MYVQVERSNIHSLVYLHFLKSGCPADVAFHYCNTTGVFNEGKAMQCLASLVPVVYVCFNRYTFTINSVDHDKFITCSLIIVANWWHGHVTSFIDDSMNK